jgi:hypothetical protein
LPLFNIRRRPRHDVAGDAPQNMRLVGRDSWRQFRDKVARDRGKRISVVETKWREPMAFLANRQRIGQRNFRELIFLPDCFGGQVTVRSRFVQRVFLTAQSAIDFGDKIPVERGEPRFDQMRHGTNSMCGGFFQASFDALQGFDAFAFEITSAGSRQHWFSGKTILNPECIFHDPFQTFLRFVHGFKVNLPRQNRKLKNPPRGNLTIALPRFHA